MTDLQYPVGTLVRKPSLSMEDRRVMIQQIAEAPGHLTKAVAGLSPQQFESPYRPGGWTVRQVAHHLPDSHMNAYIRMKLALTEEQPPVKPYNEKLWAELYDVKATPVESSVALLTSLHERWVILLRSLTPDAFDRRMMHPEHGVITVDFLLQLYAWHGRHHVAHITSLRERMGWN